MFDTPESICRMVRYKPFGARSACSGVAGLWPRPDSATVLYYFSIVSVLVRCWAFLFRGLLLLGFWWSTQYAPRGKSF